MRMARISLVAICALTCGFVQGQEKNDRPTNEKAQKTYRDALGNCSHRKKLLPRSPTAPPSADATNYVAQLTSRSWRSRCFGCDGTPSEIWAQRQDLSGVPLPALRTRVSPE
jgi:hypothetical protein